MSLVSLPFVLVWLSDIQTDMAFFKDILIVFLRGFDVGRFHSVYFRSEFSIAKFAGNQ